jgi:hypothetical protein
MLTTVGNLLGLLGFAAIRFGMRGGGFFLTLFGLVIIGALVWALTKPQGSDAAKSQN